MKIQKVEIIALKQDPNTFNRAIFAKIYTKNGLYGLGEAAVAIGTGSPACFHQIKDLAPMIIGMDANWNDVIYEKLLRNSFWSIGNGAILMAAISAIDTAIWDLKAKAANLPLYQLLGGKHRETLKAYASQFQFGWGVDKFVPFQATPEQAKPEFYAQMAQKAVDEGYKSIKANFMRFDETGKMLPYSQSIGLLDKKVLHLFEDRLSAVRDAVGYDIDIIIENHAMTDANTAIQLAAIAEPYDILFYEEPTHPLNVDTMVKIANATSIPLATGERTYTRAGFLPLLNSHSLSVIQPDIGNCGGITETKKVCDLAHTFDVSCQMHVCSSPLSVALSLHLEASIPNFAIHEHHLVNTIPSNIETCIHNYQPNKNGDFEIPELPGIGNDLTEQALKTATIEVIE
jgi:L-alanine-DL-glutamate epimerase-like enolase superfamily enzyme